MKVNADRARGLDQAELNKELKEGLEQTFRLRFQMSMGQMDGLNKVRALRKERRDDILATTGTAMTNIIVTARKRCRWSHQQSVSAPIVPPTCSTAPARDAFAGGSFAAVSRVGVQLNR